MWVICCSSPTQHLALSHVEHFLHQTESTFSPRHVCATSAHCCVHVKQDSVFVRVLKKAPCNSPGRRLLETSFSEVLLPIWHWALIFRCFRCFTPVWTPTAAERFTLEPREDSSQRYKSISWVISPPVHSWFLGVRLGWREARNSPEHIFLSTPSREDAGGPSSRPQVVRIPSPRLLHPQPSSSRCWCCLYDPPHSPRPFVSLKSPCRLHSLHVPARLASYLSRQAGDRLLWGPAVRPR